MCSLGRYTERSADTIVSRVQGSGFEVSSKYFATFVSQHGMQRRSLPFYFCHVGGKVRGPDSAWFLSPAALSTVGNL